MTRTDTTPAEPLTVTQLQELVFNQVGKNLLRYQTIELKIKDTLRLSKFELTFDGLNKYTKDKHDQITCSTFGGLIHKFMGLIEPEENLQSDKDCDAQDRTSSPEYQNGARAFMCFEFTAYRPQDFKNHMLQELQTIVKQRNDFVHNFQEQHDLTSIDGLRKALTELEQQFSDAEFIYKEIDAFCNDVSAIRDRALTAFASHFALITNEDFAAVLAILAFTIKAAPEWVSINSACNYAKESVPEKYAVVKQTFKVKKMVELLQLTGLFEIDEQSTDRGKRIVIRALPLSW